MKSLTHWFGKVYVELDVPEPKDAEQTSFCTLSVQLKGKEYCSSLALAEDQGGIVDDNDNVMYPLSAVRIAEIEEWAHNNGY
jgi:hypothetical protein